MATDHEQQYIESVLLYIRWCSIALKCSSCVTDMSKKWWISCKKVPKSLRQRSGLMIWKKCRCRSAFWLHSPKRSPLYKKAASEYFITRVSSEAEQENCWRRRRFSEKKSVNSSLKPSNRDRNGRAVETWRVNQPEHLLPLHGLLHHLTLRPCRGSVSKATAAGGSGAFPVSVNVVGAAGAALISKRAEATFLHTSAGPLAECQHITCMLNTIAGDKSEAFSCFKDRVPALLWSPKKLSDRWRD